MSQQVQLTHLRAFVTVARLHSYTRAAQALDYSEPAVFMQVKALEKAWGLTLFRKQGQEVAPTAAGDHLLPAVSATLDQLRLVERLAGGLRSKPKVVVGAGRYTGTFMVMPLLAAYTARHPEHELEFHVLERGDLAQRVIDGSVDLAIAGWLNVHSTSAERRRHQIVLARWRHDEVALFGPEDQAFDDVRQRAAGGEPVTVFAPPSAPATLSTIAALIAGELSATPRMVMLETAEAVASAVRYGLGLGVFPTLARERAATEHGLRPLRTFGRAGQFPIHLLHKRPALLAPAARCFLAYLIAHRAAQPAPLAGVGG